MLIYTRPSARSTSSTPPIEVPTPTLDRRQPLQNSQIPNISTNDTPVTPQKSAKSQGKRPSSEFESSQPKRSPKRIKTEYSGVEIIDVGRSPSFLNTCMTVTFRKDRPETDLDVDYYTGDLWSDSFEPSNAATSTLKPSQPKSTIESASVTPLRLTPVPVNRPTPPPPPAVPIDPEFGDVSTNLYTL